MMVVVIKVILLFVLRRFHRGGWYAMLCYIPSSHSRALCKYV